MICIISCTNRDNSLSRVIAEYYQSLLQKRAVNSEILDLGGLPKDFVYSALYQNAGKNAEFNNYQEVIDRLEKFVFIVPEYNGSFPGVLKTFIDGLRYPDSFNGKKAALVGLSSGIQGGTLALSHLNDILAYLGTDVMSLRVKLHRIEANMEGSVVSDPLFNQLLDEQVEKFIRF